MGAIKLRDRVSIAYMDQERLAHACQRARPWIIDFLGLPAKKKVSQASCDNCWTFPDQQPYDTPTIVFHALAERLRETHWLRVVG